jgi:hypothetical protein
MHCHPLAALLVEEENEEAEEEVAAAEVEAVCVGVSPKSSEIG